MNDPNLPNGTTESDIERRFGDIDHCECECCFELFTFEQLLPVRTHGNHGWYDQYICSGCLGTRIDACALCASHEPKQELNERGICERCENL